MKVFLSYTTADRELAATLADELARRGLDVWRDDDEILPGDDWGAHVSEALRTCDAMVVLVSPESMQSRWVRRTIDYALGSLRYEGRLVPLLLRPSKAMPWILAKMRPLRCGARTVKSIAAQVFSRLNDPKPAAVL